MDIKDSFIKDSVNLEISVTDLKRTIRFKQDRELIDNNYVVWIKLYK